MNNNEKIVNETVKMLREERMELLEMARIGYTQNGYEVYVNTDDGGDIPHFHYRKGKCGHYEFQTCIKLDRAEYFPHDGKDDVLNSQQRKELVNFLMDIAEDEEILTNWQILVREWNRNNSNMKVDKDLIMPNYRDLK